MKKIFTALSIAMLFLSTSFLFTSCEGDTYYENGAGMENQYITITPSEWKWNASENRMEVILPFEYIDQNIYEEDGAVMAGIYVNKYINGRTQEVLCNLPFLYSLYDSEFEEYYTVNIGFEVSKANRGQITFYMQDSQLKRFDITSSFDFKVTVFWSLY